MGPLFINQRRNTKSLCLEGEESDTHTATTTTTITTATSTSTRNNERVGVGEDDKDARRSNNGPTPTATGTINVSVTPCNNANSKPNPKGNNGHVRSTTTAVRITGEESTSSTEDLSNNEEFPWMKRNQMMKNRISGSGTVNNTEMNPGQFLMMKSLNSSHPNPLYHHEQHQHNQQTQQSQQNRHQNHSLLRKSQSNLQIANGGGGGNLNPPLSSSNGTIKENTFNANGASGNPSIGNNGIRKYLVLLQDCLAIKFVSAGQPHHSQHFHFAFNSNLMNNEGSSNKGNVNNSQINGAGGMESSTAEVDHSLHGLYLYKGFREANLKCYWNATLCEAIRNLDYKGYIVPSTILVFALPRFLSVLRTAWSRKMLRYPPGYKVDFVGEIEEFVAEPIPQGQFAPLSDSLCWAILELTSSSQEAFVDPIILALSTAFPSMTLPSKELVYQTLEKLIKDRKIYQTSHGYFVVTPDTFRYMNSGGDSGDWSHFNSHSSAILPLDALMTSFYESDRVSLSGHSWGSAGSANNNADEFLITSSSTMRPHSQLKRHNSLKLIRQRDLDLLGPSMGARSLSFRLAKPKSVFDSDRDDKYSSSRSKSSTIDSNTEGSSPGSKGHTSEEDNGKKNTLKDKTKPRKRSFFRRWFSFRRSKPKAKNLENSAVHLESLPRSPKTYSSISRVRQSQASINSNAATQTVTRSYENMHDIIENLGLSNEDEHLYLPLPRNISKWNSLPSSGTKNGSRSRRSIIDESPFYDTLTYTNYNGTNTIPTGHIRVDNNGSKYPTTRSVASSSLGYGSQGTYVHRGNTNTLDYIMNPQVPSVGGSGKSLDRQRIRHLSANGGGAKSTRTDSPCPSTSVSAIYASIANTNVPSASNAPGTSGSRPQRNMNFDNIYRRRPLSQMSQSQNRVSNVYTARPKSAYELLAHQNQHNQHNRKKSTESLVVQNPQLKSNIMKPSANNKPFISTTTITQNVRSTTSTELEVLLPLGKLMSDSLSTRKQIPKPEYVGLKNEKICTKEGDESLRELVTENYKVSDDKVKLVLGSPAGTLRMRGKPTTTETQITTTVNNNGTVETHFSSTGSININSGLVENCHCNKDSDVSH